jgi:hypothetical protein
MEHYEECDKVQELLVENAALEAEVFALSEEMVNLKDYIAGLEKDLQHYYSLIND